MRVIATRTDEQHGLIEEQEFIGSEALKEIFLHFGWAKPYDDTKPLPPKGVGNYEESMVYPAGRFVFKGGGAYQSKQQTSSTWVEEEWEVIIAP